MRTSTTTEGTSISHQRSGASCYKFTVGMSIEVEVGKVEKGYTEARPVWLRRTKTCSRYDRVQVS